MKYASTRQRNEWEDDRVNPVLRRLVIEAQDYAALMGWVFTATDVWRSEEEEKRYRSSGLHHAWRALDVRVRTGEWDDPGGLALATYMNTLWEYDPARPMMQCVLFKPHENATAPHVHFQVHPRTVRRTVE